MAGSEEEPTNKYIDLIDRYFAPSNGQLDSGTSYPDMIPATYESFETDFDFWDGPYDARMSWLADPRGVKQATTFWVSPVISYETRDKKHCELRLISKRRNTDNSAKPTFGIELWLAGAADHSNLAELDSDRLLVAEVRLDDRGTTERRLRESYLGDLLDFGKIVSLFREVRVPEADGRNP